MNTVDGRNAFTTFKHYISTGSILLSCAQERDLSFKCFFIFFFFWSVLKVSLMTRIGEGT